MGFSITNKTIYKSWTDLKQVLTDKFGGDKGKIQFDERNDRYYIFILDNDIEYFTELWILTSVVKGINETQNNTDRTDFETNYKSFANETEEPIDENGNPIVTVIGLPKHTSRISRTSIDKSFSTSSWYELLKIEDEGQFDAIQVEFFNHKWKIKITIDNVVVLEASELDFKNQHYLNTNTGGMDIVQGFPIVENRDSFLWILNTPSDFISSIKIEGQKTGSNSGCDSAMIVWRKKI